jgi:hypothetical protein
MRIEKHEIMQNSIFSKLAYDFLPHGKSADPAAVYEQLHIFGAFKIHI